MFAKMQSTSITDIMDVPKRLSPLETFRFFCISCEPSHHDSSYERLQNQSTQIETDFGCADDNQKSVR